MKKNSLILTLLLTICLFPINLYAFTIDIDLGAVTDALEEAAGEISESINVETNSEEVEEVQATEEVEASEQVEVNTQQTNIYSNAIDLYFWETPSTSMTKHPLFVGFKAYRNGNYLVAIENWNSCSYDVGISKDINNNHIHCTVALGMMYLKGIGTDKDIELGLEYIQYANNNISDRNEEIKQFAMDLERSALDERFKKNPIEPFTVIFDSNYGSDVMYRSALNFKGDGMVGDSWQGDDGTSSASNKERLTDPDTHYAWYFDEGKFKFSETSTCFYHDTGEIYTKKSDQDSGRDSSCERNEFYTESIFDFENNFVNFSTIDGDFEGTIIDHNFGKKEKIIDSDIAQVRIKSCSDFENDDLEKVYKDFFFGMTKKEVTFLSECKNGKLTDLKNYNYQDAFMIEKAYKYTVTAHFTDGVVDEIVSEPYNEIHDIGSSSGIAGINELKDVLSKKYKLLHKPSEQDIQKFNDYGKKQARIDHVFEVKGSDRIILLSQTRAPTQDGRYWFMGWIHYLSEDKTKEYLKELKSNTVSADDF